MQTINILGPIRSRASIADSRGVIASEAETRRGFDEGYLGIFISSTSHIPKPGAILWDSELLSKGLQHKDIIKRYPDHLHGELLLNMSMF